MTIYVDVLFLINFSVDYIVLTLTGVFFHYKVKRWREILAAFLMSIYALWALLLCGSYFLLMLTALITLSAVCIFVYPIRDFLNFIKCIIVFTALCFILGGIVDFLFRMMGNISDSFAGERDDSKVLVFAILAVLSSVLIYFGNRLLNRGRNVKYVHAEMRFFDHTYKAELMVDTGNLVLEPLSGRRVIFLTEEYAKKSGLYRYINNNEDFLKSKRIICVDTAGGKRVLSAYLCNDIKLKDKTVIGAIAIMHSENGECRDGIFPSALL